MVSFKIPELTNKIWNHPVYKEKYEKLQKFEENREFCGHFVNHFLDTARLMWIMNLEENAGLDKDLIYAAAFLHDIGRCDQYENGTPHDEASAEIAEELMTLVGFNKEDIKAVKAAILRHRSKTGNEEEKNVDLLSQKSDLLSIYLNKADKMSRNCYACAARDKCNWPEEKKNLLIVV